MATDNAAPAMLQTLVRIFCLHQPLQIMMMMGHLSLYSVIGLAK
jgi:hypothetical protein